MTIRISTATTDDLPEIVASIDALFASDAGTHNAAATNLRWAAENGIAYYTSLLADSDASADPAACIPSGWPTWKASTCIQPTATAASASNS